MALASYANLQTVVADFLARSDMTSVIPDLILLGEKRIQREVRTPDMEVSYTGTISSGSLAVPTDFLEWKVVYVDNDGAKRLQPKALEWIFQNYPTRTASGGGIPKFIARSGTNFVFGPYPDSGYTVNGAYYKRLTTVSSSWNALATANPDLYLYASLAAAKAYLMDDPRIAIWEQSYVNAREALNSEGIRQDISGAPLRVTRG